MRMSESIIEKVFVFFFLFSFLTFALFILFFLDYISSRVLHSGASAPAVATRAVAAIIVICVLVIVAECRIQMIIDRN